jgi:hypothetical protein
MLESKFDNNYYQTFDNIMNKYSNNKFFPIEEIKNDIINIKSSGPVEFLF